MYPIWLLVYLLAAVATTARIHRWVLRSARRRRLARSAAAHNARWWIPCRAPAASNPKPAVFGKPGVATEGVFGVKA
jgi:hypothetical protein